jgi:hypothetical protein
VIERKKLRVFKRHRIVIGQPPTTISVSMPRC